MKFKFCPNCGEKDTVRKFDDTNYECSHCGWHFWNNAKTAVGVVFVRNDKMLVSKRAEEPNKGKCDFPGGFVDFGENPYDCAVREVAEETSVQIKREDLELLEVYTNRYGQDFFTVDVLFLVRRWEGDFVAQDDSSSLEWHPLSFVHDPLFQGRYSTLDEILMAKSSARPSNE